MSRPTILERRSRGSCTKNLRLEPFLKRDLLERRSRTRPYDDDELPDISSWDTKPTRGAPKRLRKSSFGAGRQPPCGTVGCGSAAAGAFAFSDFPPLSFFDFSFSVSLVPVCSGSGIFSGSARGGETLESILEATMSALCFWAVC